MLFNPNIIMEFCHISEPFFIWCFGSKLPIKYVFSYILRVCSLSCAFVWQVDYNTSGAFMSWLRLYNGDFVRMLPWTVLMDELTNQWSLEDAVKYILKESYPDLTMEELWNEYKTEVEVFLQNN